MLPNAPRTTFDLTALKSLTTPPLGGVIGSMSHIPMKSSSKQKLVSNTSSNDPSRNSLCPDKTSEVHVVQSTIVDKSSKGKIRSKARPKMMPQNRALLSHLLVMPLKESPSIHASSARRITTLKIVPNDLKFVACSKGPHYLERSLSIPTNPNGRPSSVFHFHRFPSVHDEYSYKCGYQIKILSNTYSDDRERERKYPFLLYPIYIQYSPYKVT